MFHPSRVFLYELLVNGDYSYVHSWLVTIAMQLVVIKIISPKGYYGYYIIVKFLHFSLISLQYESSFLYHNHYCKATSWKRLQVTISPRVGN